MTSAELAHGAMLWEKSAKPGAVIRSAVVKAYTPFFLAESAGPRPLAVSQCSVDLATASRMAGTRPSAAVLDFANASRMLASIPALKVIELVQLEACFL